MTGLQGQKSMAFTKIPGTYITITSSILIYFRSLMPTLVNLYFVELETTLLQSLPVWVSIGVPLSAAVAVRALSLKAFPPPHVPPPPPPDYTHPSHSPCPSYCRLPKASRPGAIGPWSVAIWAQRPTWWGTAPRDRCQLLPAARYCSKYSVLQI